MWRRLASRTVTGSSKSSRRTVSRRGRSTRSSIEVPCDGDEQQVSDDVFAQVEDVIMKIGASFVPIKHDGVIYIRPPVG